MISYGNWVQNKKYRFIVEYSPDGAKMVDSVLDREHSIAKQLKTQAEHIKELENKYVYQFFSRS